MDEVRCSADHATVLLGCIACVSGRDRKFDIDLLYLLWTVGKVFFLNKSNYRHFFY